VSGRARSSRMRLAAPRSRTVLTRSARSARPSSPPAAWRAGRNQRGPARRSPRCRRCAGGQIEFDQPRQRTASTDLDDGRPASTRVGREKVWSDPLPFLLQRRIGTRRAVLSFTAINRMIRSRCEDLAAATHRSPASPWLPEGLRHRGRWRCWTSVISRRDDGSRSIARTNRLSYKPIADQDLGGHTSQRPKLPDPPHSRLGAVPDPRPLPPDPIPRRAAPQWAEHGGDGRTRGCQMPLSRRWR
jgi:hypothetical protein